MEDWRALDYPALITWDLWYSCNYRCSYCWFEAPNQWSELARRYPPLPVEKWLEAWQRMHSLYGTLRIDILGGEPLLFPGMEDLFSGLARQHRIHITTNLSISTARLERLLSVIGPDRACFQNSFHPEFADLPAFLENLSMLRQAGYDPSVSYITWPPFLEKMGHYRDVFKEKGYFLSVMTFQGTWEGKKYPESFTREEQDLIASFMPCNELKAAEVKYRLERKSTHGKLCHSGRVYANLKPNGDLYRCGQAETDPIGSLFDPGFRFFDAPKPCPYQHCNCQEFKYLDELKR
jgi:MoaA/NifB/PqqE/SkfB family radical SAM enzyme